MSTEQYKTGVVSVTSGNAVVTGTSTLWDAAITAGNVFKLDLDGDAAYEIASVDSDTQITLTTTYKGATASTQAYMIQRSFTPVYGFMRPFQGDADLADMLRTQLIDKLDAALAGAAPVHGVALLYKDFTQYATPADTSEHDANVYELPANTLDVNNKSIRVKAWGTTGASATSTTVRIELAGASLYFVSTGATKPWNIESVIARRGASSQYTTTNITVNGLSPIVDQTYRTEDLTTSLEIKVTLQSAGGTAGDGVSEGMTVELLQ